jgi:tetratricopeptide (TPR) repeat protein
MKTLLPFVAVITLLVAAPAARADKVRNVQVGEVVPPFTVTTTDGGSIRSDDWRGKVVVLVYVSAEQRSSERAAQAAAALGRELRGKALEIVYLAGEADRKPSRDSIPGPVGLDREREVYGAIGLIVLPTTLVIDRAGRLVRVLSSYTGDYDHVLGATVRHALGLIDDDALAAALATRSNDRDADAERLARHRAAARLLREKRLTADAERELRAALEIAPGDVEARLDLASLLLDLNRVDEAAALVDGVLAGAPGNRRGKLLSGIVLFRRDRLDEAQRTLEEVLLLNPDPARTHYYLGLICERRGDAAAALEHLKEAAARMLEEHPL